MFFREKARKNAGFGNTPRAKRKCSLTKINAMKKTALSENFSWLVTKIFLAGNY